MDKKTNKKTTEKTIHSLTGGTTGKTDTTKVTDSLVPLGSNPKTGQSIAIFVLLILIMFGSSAAMCIMYFKKKDAVDK